MFHLVLTLHLTPLPSQTDNVNTQQSVKNLPVCVLRCMKAVLTGSSPKHEDATLLNSTELYYSESFFCCQEQLLASGSEM